MSTYKVIQDIEAEDHILGPLSLRQFIYGLIAAFFLYLCFISITKHAAFLLLLFLPPALFCVFFAFPFGKDQPTEVWALAKIRFIFKPRRRIWNQSGIKELVTITVPKRVEIQRTDGLSQTEVKSRLRALADTIDSRGWVIKNVSSNIYSRPGLLDQDGSDRLLSITSIPQPVPDYEVDPSNDVLDDQVSPLAQQFSSLIQTSTQAHHQQLLDSMNTQLASTPAPRTPQWFTQQGPAAQQPIVQDATPTPTSDAALLAQIKSGLAAQAQSHLHPLQPHQAQPTPVVAAQPQAVDQTVSQPAQPPVTAPPDPAILNLAKRNDLNVSTLAREAHKAKSLDDGDEVVISLH